MYEDETLDLVNDQDEVIGQISRNEFQARRDNPPGNVRVADGFVMNSQGQLWIPRRTADKQIAPNGLDFSVGEHLEPGESYEAGMLRGFAEELNLHLSSNDLQLLKIIPPQKGMPLFRAIFLYKTDVTPNYNRKDFTEYMWLTPQEVESRVAAGDKAKRNLVPTIKEVFPY